MENSSGDISAADHLVYFVFGSRWGFLGRPIEWLYLRFRQVQDGGAEFKWRYLSGGSSDLHSVWL